MLTDWSPVRQRSATFSAGSVRWAQLEPGRFHATRRLADAGPLTFAKRRFNLGFQISGELTGKRSIVGVAGDASTEARWFGSRISHGEVGFARGEVDLTTRGPSSFYSVTIDMDALARNHPHGRGIVATLAAEGRPIDRDQQRATTLRNFISTVLEMPQQLANARSLVTNGIEHTLLPILTLAGEEHVREDRPRSVARRVAAVRACEAYVREHIDSSPTLYELSLVSGLRMRSLINAFQAVTGLSPMAYLRRQRLNGARQSLLSAEKPRRVIDVAANWGFWHMGHFTAEYRAMFGESPSETLRKR